jgi:hypothetical protein
MAPQEDWKKKGGFKVHRVRERRDALRIEIRRVYLFLKVLLLFLALLAVEYPLCGIYFRLVRQRDAFWLDLGCALAALALCSWLSRKLIRDALKEKVPVYVVAGLFLFFTFLLTGFFRFSFQLANGLLDFSYPEVHRVVVTDKKISIFGGSIREGLNPMAHMIYFKDWNDGEGDCELLLPPDAYYMVDQGGPLDIAVRPGFFHLTWMQAYQLVQPQVPQGISQN